MLSFSKILHSNSNQSSIWGSQAAILFTTKVYNGKFENSIECVQNWLCILLLRQLTETV